MIYISTQLRKKYCPLELNAISLQHFEGSRAYGLPSGLGIIVQTARANSGVHKLKKIILGPSTLLIEGSPWQIIVSQK